MGHFRVMSSGRWCPRDVADRYDLYGRTITLPSIPKPSCSAHLYLKTPAVAYTTALLSSRLRDFYDASCPITACGTQSKVSEGGTNR
jgi:hypothetical protein